MKYKPLLISPEDIETERIVCEHRLTEQTDGEHDCFPQFGYKPILDYIATVQQAWRRIAELESDIEGLRRSGTVKQTPSAAQTAEIAKAWEVADKALARRLADVLYDDGVVLRTPEEDELDRQGAAWAIEDALSDTRKGEKGAE